MYSTAGNLKRSKSCQEEKCVIAWSCGKDPATTATDSNPGRHHHTQRNYRSPLAHGRRSNAPKVSRVSSSTEEIEDISSRNAKSKHQDDFDGKTEAEQEHKSEECRDPTEMASTDDKVEISVQSYKILVDSCCKHDELQSNIGTETVRDNIAESRTTIETLVSIISPAEDDATSVSMDIVALPADVSCDIKDDVLGSEISDLQSNIGTETVGDNITESRTTIETLVSIVSPAEDGATSVSMDIVALPADVSCDIKDDVLGTEIFSELQANTGTETVSDNITESRPTIETLVSIISPAEDGATSVSMEIIALPEGVSCDINEEALGTGFDISRQQLSRTAVEETDPSKANNIDGDRAFEDAGWCINNSATSTKLTRQEVDDRLSVTKRRGRHKGRSQRIGKKWKPIAEDVVQLDFRMSLFPRNVSVEDDADNSAAITKELENFERLLDCPENADDKSSTENGSGITADPKHTDGCDNAVQNCSENLECPEQKSSEDNKSLHTTSTSTKDDIIDYEDNDNLISFYGDKLPHFSRASLGRPNEPYLPGCQKLRMKKKWKKTKARIQVKSKHCRTLNNTVHGQPIYINFRVMQRMHMILRSLYPNPCYSTLSLKKIDKSKGIPVAGEKETSGKCHSAYNRDASRPPARPRFAMDAYNADSDLSADLVNVLVNLQHRDLLPEDYELLLRLDERVAQKTIDSSVLSTLKTEVVGPEGRAEPCAICMEPYEAGHTMKYLPCGHCYHDTCIDRWLSNSSQNCPLDGVPIDDAL